MIGRVLDERYTLLECVGSGGMADVYRAHDKLLDRFVAIKILHPQFNNDENFRARFQYEAQAAARLSHHNIVNIYDVGKDQADDYIVMEYVSGETLQQLIERLGALSPAQALAIGVEIADALENAHQNNIIHCDIKPHNILIPHHGRIKVTDFGIARAAASSTITQTGTILGSVHYFSPEQAQGGVITAKSDIYSLGVVIYEMLTGTVPFTGETPIGVALKHLHEDYQPLSNINPTLPPIFDMIISKCLSKEPNDRYDNMSDVITDLRLAQNYIHEQNKELLKTDSPTQALPPLVNNEKTANKSKRFLALSSRMGLILLFIILFVGFGIGVFLAFGKFWVTKDITVPNVVGKHQDSAYNILQAEQLYVSRSEVYNNNVAPGYVVSQAPEAGAIVKEKRTIMLVVSRGGEVIGIPDVRGLDRRDAELQLKSAGLTISQVEEVFSDTIPINAVVDQNPRPPVQVNKGSSVDLSVSKGAQLHEVVLPDFRGLPLSTAVEQIGNLKLVLGTVTEEINNNYQAGTIAKQDPASGVTVEENSTVNLVVAKYLDNAYERQEISIQATVPDGSRRQVVQIVVTSAGKREVVYEKTHKPGDQLVKNLTITTPARVQVYINGALRQEQTY